MGYTHGKKWTTEAIKERVLEVVKNCELDRMPSQKEVETYYKDCCLTNAISKRMGWYKLADELGLSIKESDTYFGKKHEQLLAEKLMSEGYEVIRMAQNFPYDLLVNNAVKIDVKASRLYRGQQGNFYSFNLEKPFTTCDLLVLLTINDDSTIKNYYIIPSSLVYRNTQISIGEIKSKYDSFIDKWDYIEKFDEFYQEIV